MLSALLFFGWQSLQISGLCIVNTLNRFKSIYTMFSSPFCSVSTLNVCYFPNLWSYLHSLPILPNNRHFLCWHIGFPLFFFSLTKFILLEILSIFCTSIMWLQFTFFIISSDFSITYEMPQGNHDKMTQIEWFKTTEVYSLIVLEATSLKSRCQQGFTPFKGSRILPVSFSFLEFSPFLGSLVLWPHIILVVALLVLPLKKLHHASAFTLPSSLCN